MVTLTAALLMSLALPGSSDGERGLPLKYRRLAIPGDRLRSAAARGHGRSVFLMNCAICHGDRGDGLGPRREGLIGRPRDFTNTLWRASTSPRRVVYAIREGRAQTSMPAWPTLTDDEVWDLTAYILSLGEPR
jgi:mono/diheme cytochrome c family protein